MSVEDFAGRKWHGKGRHVVTMEGKRLALPHAWSKKRWDEASQRERRLVFSACTSFKDYMLYIFFPYASYKKAEKEPDVLPDFVSQFCDEIQLRTPPDLLPFDCPDYDPSLPWRVCQVWPTNCLKSSMSQAYSAWLIGNNPDASIVTVTSNAWIGQRFVRWHGDNFKENLAYQFVFGNLDPPNTRDKRVWNSESITVDRPLNSEWPTFATVGYQGAVSGIRADVALVDDLAEFQNVKTDTAKDEQWTWLSQILEARLHPDRRLFWLVGTRQAVGDIYERAAIQAKKTGAWWYKELPMISDEEIAAGHWPPKRIDPTKPISMDNIRVHPDLKTLWSFHKGQKLAEEWVNNPETFAMRRQHTLTDEHGGSLQPDEVASCCWDGEFDELTATTKPYLPLCNYLEGGLPASGTQARALYEAAGITIKDCVIVGDLAATEPVQGKDPDWTCFQLWTRLEDNGRHVLLDQLRFRTGNPDVVREELVRFVGPYRSMVNVVALEANAVDQFFAKDVSKYLMEHCGIPVTIMTLKLEKDELVSAFFRMLRSRQIVIPYGRDRHTSQEMTPFHDELLAYRPGGKGHDDTVITAAQHLKFLGEDAGYVSAWVTGSEEAQARGRQVAGDGGEQGVTPIVAPRDLNNIMAFGQDALGLPVESTMSNTRDDLLALRQEARAKARTKSDPLRDYVNNQR